MGRGFGDANGRLWEVRSRSIEMIGESAHFVTSDSKSPHHNILLNSWSHFCQLLCYK
jgi:hypothetical protein